MRVLALDSTTRAGSVALVVDDRIVEERGGDPSRTHGERLPGELLDLLAAHGLRADDVDVFAVAAGPGSFTGLRIGIATMQGLAFATGRRVVAVSALDALAQIASRRLDAGSLVASWIDAHRRDVFAALYRVASGELFSSGRIIVVDEAAVNTALETLERWQPHVSGATLHVVGDGVAANRESLQALAPDAIAVPTPILAGAVGRMACLAAAAGLTIAPGAVQPIYVRRPDVELAREKRA